MRGEKTNVRIKRKWLPQPFTSSTPPICNYFSVELPQLTIGAKVTQVMLTLHSRS